MDALLNINTLRTIPGTRIRDKKKQWDEMRWGDALLWILKLLEVLKTTTACQTSKEAILVWENVVVVDLGYFSAVKFLGLPPA